MSAATYARRSRNIPPSCPVPRKIDWRPEMIRFLGKISDRRFAKRFGIGEGSVRKERHRRGISGVKTDSWMVLRDPNLRKLLQLQTMEVVKLTGLNEKTVRFLRHDLGMKQPGIPTKWTPDVVRLIGRAPDEAIARRTGLKLASVRLKRRQMGIKYRSAKRWTEREIKLVKRLPIEEAVRATGRTIRAVAHLRDRLGLARTGLPTNWTPTILKLLGRVPDKEVARRTGYKVETVRLKRTHLGVKHPTLNAWTQHEIDLAKKLPIGDAVRKTGRTRRAVMVMRKTLGLDGALGRPG